VYLPKRDERADHLMVGRPRRPYDRPGAESLVRWGVTAAARADVVPVVARIVVVALTRAGTVGVPIATIPVHPFLLWEVWLHGI